jgi:hypothetical protein
MEQWCALDPTVRKRHIECEVGKLDDKQRHGTNEQKPRRPAAVDAE